jgi:hypothetical protein
MIIVRAQTEGAGKAGCLSAPAALRAKIKNHASIVTTGSPEIPGLPCANGFNGFLRALPGEPGFLATIACKIIASQA